METPENISFQRQAKVSVETREPALSRAGQKSMEEKVVAREYQEVMSWKEIAKLLVPLTLKRAPNN
ncbi:hypothetical protein L0Y69_03625 [bacterium]|nr:hypothetical protein [bacterium]